MRVCEIGTARVPSGATEYPIAGARRWARGSLALFAWFALAPICALGGRAEGVLGISPRQIRPGASAYVYYVAEGDGAGVQRIHCVTTTPSGRVFKAAKSPDTSGGRAAAAFFFPDDFQGASTSEVGEYVVRTFVDSRAPAIEEAPKVFVVQGPNQPELDFREITLSSLENGAFAQRGQWVLKPGVTGRLELALKDSGLYLVMFVGPIIPGASGFTLSACARSGARADSCYLWGSTGSAFDDAINKAGLTAFLKAVLPSDPAIQAAVAAGKVATAKNTVDVAGALTGLGLTAAKVGTVKIVAVAFAFGYLSGLVEGKPAIPLGVALLPITAEEPNALFSLELHSATPWAQLADASYDVFAFRWPAEGTTDARGLARDANALFGTKVPGLNLGELRVLEGAGGGGGGGGGGAG